MKEPAWSHSALQTFEQCPRKYYYLKVAKSVKEVPSDAMTWGKTVHTHLEQRIRDGTPLPAILAPHEPIAAKIAASKGTVLVEQQLALTRDLQPTSWFDKSVWLRCILDVAIIGKAKAVILDWKTGKRKFENDQLKLFAITTFHHHPEIDTVDTGFVWLKENKIDKETFTREQLPELWQEFIPRVERLNLAFEHDRWPAKPSGLCSWCPVGKDKCEFWKQR